MSIKEPSMLEHDCGTDCSQDSKETTMTQDDNGYPNISQPSDLTNLNNNNYRKRVLEDITGEVNKVSKMDPIFSSGSDNDGRICNVGPEVKHGFSQIYCLDDENSSETVKYYVIDRSQPPEVGDKISLAPCMGREILYEDYSQPKETILIHSTPAEQQSNNVSQTPEQSQSLDLSLKSTGLRSTQGRSTPIKKRVTIIASCIDSPATTSLSTNSPLSISPNDNRFKLSTPFPYQPSTPSSESTPQVTGMSELTSSQGSSFVYTPHPKSGQLFYMSTLSDASPDLPSAPIQTPETLTKANVGLNATPYSQLIPGSLALNSSSEEARATPQDNKENDRLTLNAKKFVSNRQKYDLLNSPDMLEDEPRESHNLKERRRRARIKEACDLMRTIIPGMSEKTDKATVFEFAARYIHFLKTYTGSKYDKDFLVKYSPY